MSPEQRDILEEALIQTAYMQIALEKNLSVIPVGGWGSGRAHVPEHWRPDATARAWPYIKAFRDVMIGDEA